MSRSARDWLAVLSLKRKDLRDNRPDDWEPLHELFRFGLIECGCDALLFGDTTGDIVREYYVVTGDDWLMGLRERLRTDTGFEERIQARFKCCQEYLYLRLSAAGIEVKRSGNWPEVPVPFQADLVEYFDENESEAELARYAEDQKLRVYVIENLKTPMKEVEAVIPGGIKHYVTVDMVRRRVTGGHPPATCARQDAAAGISRFRRATTSRTWCSMVQERRSRCGVETASSGGGRSGGRFPPMRSGQGPVAQGSGTLSRGCGLVCRSRFDGPSSRAAPGSRSAKSGRNRDSTLGDSSRRTRDCAREPVQPGSASDPESAKQAEWIPHDQRRRCSASW